MGHDPLSDVLRTIRLTGAIFYDCIACAPWVAEQPPHSEILPHILPGADHLIAYHVMLEGRCFATVTGGEPIEVTAGDVIVFTNGDPHVLSSSPGMRADPAALRGVQSHPDAQLPFILNFGDEGATTARFVCGFLACDTRPFNPLLSALPRLMKMQAPPPGAHSWLRDFIGMAVVESALRQAGGESVLARISELMFIEVVRHFLTTLPPGNVGWLAGLKDPCVGRALASMHARPSHDWTLEHLAQEAAVSRSVLAERFTAIVGLPPMHYLASWRMQLALALLRSSNANIATVAAQIGYGSEASFSRAFKKAHGMPPSMCRLR